jgi:hypothetical protein
MREMGSHLRDLLGVNRLIEVNDAGESAHEPQLSRVINEARIEAGSTLQYPAAEERVTSWEARTCSTRYERPRTSL